MPGHACGTVESIAREGFLELVSIVVATRNSGRTLEACLKSARRQDYPLVEIIVVDNHSSDDTARIAAGHADLLLQAGPERCAQRNAGIRAAHGEYVLVLDADMVLEPNVISAALAASAGGRNAVAVPEISFGEGFWSECKTFERSFYRSDAVVSGARFFTRADLLEIGGYDEELVAFEDWDISIRIEAQHPLAFADATIRHDEGRQTLPNLFAKKRYYGTWLPAFVRKHGVEAWKRINPMRSSLLRGMGQFMRRPALGAGVVIVKLVEMTGGLLGTLNPSRHLLPPQSAIATLGERAEERAEPQVPPGL